MINKIKELQAKFKYLSMRTDLQLKEEIVNTTCLDCDTSLEICTCMDDTIDISDHDGIGNAIDNLNNAPPQETPLDKLFKVSSIELDQEINNLIQENLFNLLHDEESKEETIKEALLQMKKTPMTFIPDERTFSEKEVLELMYKAFEAGYKKYEVVEAGLEGLETEIECNWIFEKYNKI